MNWLLRYDASTTRESAGGKGANLAFLMEKGFQVPEAIGVSADAFVAHVEACRTEGMEDTEALQAAIAARPLEPGLLDGLKAFIEEAGGRVSVRSSATLEDSKTHSFAGQFLTVLNVGAGGIEDAVRRVWASVFSPNVSAYLERAGLDKADLKMAIVVQRQLDSRVSGVALGDAKRAVVEAVFGQGEAVVSGEVSTDHWEVSKGRLVLTQIAHKDHRRGLPQGDPSGELAREELSAAEQDGASLTDGEVLAVAKLVGQIAQAFEDKPQDVEFSFVGDELYVLQTRDVTSSLPLEVPPLGPWEPPGKGNWGLDNSHFTRPVTPVFAELFPDAMRRGFSKSCARYGALLSHIDIDFVNRFAYSRIRPLGAPEDANTKPPPPAFVFKILSKLVPSLRRRIKTANKIWESREWRAQAEEWKEAKARSTQKHLALQKVDLASLDDKALFAHFEEVVAQASAMVEQHHTYNFAPMLPQGDLLAHISRWCEEKPSMLTLMSLLSGSSDSSADLQSEDAQRMADAIGQSPKAQELLRLDEENPTLSDAEAADALQALRTLEDEAGKAIDAYLELREFRVSEGLDPCAPCLFELPLVLWRGVRHAALHANNEQTNDTNEEDVLAQCLKKIPEAHHETFHALLAEARLTFGIRDERALYSDIWAWGIMRTVFLEIGRRLATRTPPRIIETSDILQATTTEVKAMFLHDASEPSAQTLQERARFQQSYEVSVAPTSLGPPPYPPPPPDLLSGGARRLAEAFGATFQLILAPAPPPPKEGSMEFVGRPASGGDYVGTVHVVNSTHDASSLKKDAVLVVGAGSSSFTMLAPLASAVIAEGGGLLSHVAIVCREYRIPCVCGCTGVLSRLKNGDRVRVDGTRGIVSLLDPPAT